MLQIWIVEDAMDRSQPQDWKGSETEYYIRKVWISIGMKGGRQIVDCTAFYS
jgi:hypothetical protein